MSSAVPATRANWRALVTEIERLNGDVQRLKNQAATVHTPQNGTVKKVVLQVFGIWEEIKMRQQDCTKLASNLIWVTDQVLNRMSTDAGGENSSNETAQEVSRALLKTASDIAEFLHKPVTAKQRVASERQEMIEKFLKDLDDMRLKFVEVNIATLRARDGGLSVAYGLAKDLNIPSHPAVFFGREQVLASITHLLLQEQACRIPLMGATGIGKTSIALAAINDPSVLAKYERNMVFFSCDSTATANGIIQALKATFRVESESSSHSSLLAYLRARNKFVLLVLDSLETALSSDDSESVRQLLEELGQIPRVSLLITTTSHSPSAGVKWEKMDAVQGLPLDVARQMWAGIARKQDGKLDLLLERLDGIPLALQLMAHQGWYFTPTELLASYENTAKILTVGRRSRLGTLEVCIELSLRSIIISEEPHAQNLLSVLCLLPDGATLETLQEMLPSHSDTIAQALSTLRHTAIVYQQKNRFKTLSPIREVICASHPPKSSDWEDVRQYCIRLCSCADHDGTSHTNGKVEPIVAEFGNINAILLLSWRTLRENDNIDQLLQATWSAATVSYTTGCGDPVPLLNQARKRLSDVDRSRDVAECKRRLGDSLCKQAHYSEAAVLLEEALSAFESMSELQGVAQSMHSLGEVRRWQGRLADAIPIFQEARSVFHAIGDVRGTAQSLYSLGDMFRLQARCEEAVSMLEEAKAAFEALGDMLRTAECKQNLGEVFKMQSRHAEAVALFEEAKSAFDANSAPLLAAQCMRSLGEILSLQSVEEATSALETAKTAFDEMGNPLEAAHCLRSLADVLIGDGEYAKGADKLEEARSSYRLIQEALFEAQCTHKLGDVLCMQSHYREATIMLEEARSAFKALGEPLGAARCLQSLAEVLRKLSRYDDAMRMLRGAKTAFEEIDERYGAAQCMQSLGNILRAQGRDEEAARMLERARDAFVAIGDESEAAMCTEMLGWIFCDEGWDDEGGESDDD
ncbi:TPR-like protein [Calocera cornea HHB12733]|uniref:TPR-like protein n=1 Tax=Calocera cornea HHB12733 TaxID=1353952 RepID=A0A165CMB1_9BASI|nr:TPR-like protein [Calocera cornea HHB12733]